MAFELKITHLCVGQGLSVLIELDYDAVWPETGRKRFVGLLDLGSSIGGRRFYSAAIGKIIDAVKTNNNTIDYVHISHFDEDHYNKFKKLSARYRQEQGKKITITDLIYGSFGKLDDDTIGERTECFDDYIITNAPQVNKDKKKYRDGDPYCETTGKYVKNINIPLEKDYFFRINTLLYHAHLFSAGDLTGGTNEGVVINTGSSIILVTIVYDSPRYRFQPCFSYLFTGDATIHTFKVLNRECELNFGREKKLMLLSHHGTKLHVADNDDNDFRTLDEFLDAFRPSAAVVSAKCKNQAGWAHPDINTITCYERKMSSVTGFNNNVSAFTWNDREEKMKIKQKATSRKIYGTYYIDSAADGSNYDTYVNVNSKKYDIVAKFSSVSPDDFTIEAVLRQ